MFENRFPNKKVFRSWQEKILFFYGGCENPALSQFVWKENDELEFVLLKL